MRNLQKGSVGKILVIIVSLFMLGLILIVFLFFQTKQALNEARNNNSYQTTTIPVVVEGNAVKPVSTPTSQVVAPKSSVQNQQTSISSFKPYDSNLGISLLYPADWTITTNKSGFAFQSLKNVDGVSGNIIMTGNWSIVFMGLPQNGLDNMRKDIEQKSNIIINGIKAYKKVVTDNNTFSSYQINLVTESKLVYIYEKWFVGGSIDEYNSTNSNRNEVLEIYKKIDSSIKFK